jgi:Na+-driven multidrug efflux pump
MLFGLNSSIATLASQLIGMEKVADTGMYLNGGRIVNAVIAVPMILCLVFSEAILLSWG